MTPISKNVCISKIPEIVKGYDNTIHRYSFIHL